MMTFAHTHDIETDKYPVQVSDSDPGNGINNCHTFNFEQSCYPNTSTACNQSSHQEESTPALSKYEEKQRLQRLADEQHQRKRKLYFTQSDPFDKHSSSRASPTHQRRQPTKYRAYTASDIRIKSFIGFTSASNKSQETFAASGFFYKGFSDMVACFHCGFSYKNWQVNDDPFLIHKTFQPDCDFINELCGNGVTSSADLVDDHDKDIEMREVTVETKKLSI